MNRWGAFGAAATLLTCASAFVIAGQTWAAFVMACGAVGTAISQSPAAPQPIRAAVRRWRPAENLALIAWPGLVLMAHTVVAVSGCGHALLAASAGFLAFLYMGACAGAGQYPLHRVWWLLPAGLAGPALGSDAISLDDIIPLLALAGAWTAAAQLPARLLRALDHRSQRIRHFAQLADTDPLTGLRNRRALTRDLHAAAREGGVRGTGALAILDLDDFKLFNDTHGHLAGDTLLADFAAFLDATVHPADLVYRFGGEEFVLLLPCTPLEVATSQVERLTHAWHRRDGHVTFSAGIATLTAGRACLEAADANLYLAKQAGRNLVIAERSQTSPALFTLQPTGSSDVATAPRPSDSSSSSSPHLREARAASPSGRLQRTAP